MGKIKKATLYLDGSSEARKIIDEIDHLSSPISYELKTKRHQNPLFVIDTGLHQITVTDLYHKDKEFAEKVERAWKGVRG